MALAALDAAAALRAGDAAFSRSEYFAAVRHFSEAIDADATSAMLLHKRASAHISLGDHAAGARDLSAALELEPSSIQFLLQRCISGTCNLHFIPRPGRAVCATAVIPKAMFWFYCSPAHGS